MKIICLLSARNLGDAVLHADALRRLQLAHKADRWIVWTFAQARFLFEGLPDTEIVCSDFPMGSTSSRFTKNGGWRSFFAAIRHIRSIGLVEAIDLVGDLRERLSLRLLGAVRWYSPEWETGHPFRNHIRTLPFLADRKITVPASLVNLYDAQMLMLRAIDQDVSKDLNLPRRGALSRGHGLQIGLHPLASVEFKLWPIEHWVELVALLSENIPGSSFTLFGAPNERTSLQALADGLKHSKAPTEIFTASLPEFKARLSNMDLLFGLDSFSVHLAHSLGVPSVVLIGANDQRIFTPPSGVPVMHSGRCPDQPCGGRPRCIGTDHQYSCMVDITPQDVLRSAPISSISRSIFSPELPT